MIIGSKLPPEKLDVTYFGSGRAAFAFLLGEVVKPKKVLLPVFTCWSLVSTMTNRFPRLKLEFYKVDRNLKCYYPAHVKKNELLVFIHYFGIMNRTKLPPSDGVLLEDISHAQFSKINYTGDFVFGSFRKTMRVADGGFINKFFNPIYEKSNKLDTWLRYQSTDWSDVREAENMIDRDWQITDISSQSLAVILGSNPDLIRLKRQKNEKFLYENIKTGKPLVKYQDNECPLVHNRILNSKKERDSLREFLFTKKIFTSIHWPTHEAVLKSKADFRDTLWIEDHIISIPVSQDYNLNDMEYIADSINEWESKNKK